MELPNPAPSLYIGMQDVAEILDRILKKRNWQDFDVMTIKLVYVPHYLFNYDIVASEEKMYQGVSGMLAMDGVDGSLRPEIPELLKVKPIEYEEEPSHEYEFEVLDPILDESEAREVARIRLSTQYGIDMDSITVTGFKLIYWPVWRVYVTLPAGTYRIDVEGVGGIAFNVQEVPEREKGWIEVTKETLDMLKTPKGWMELTKKALKVTVQKGAKKTGSTKGLLTWLFKTRVGRYTLLLILLLIFLLVVLK